MAANLILEETASECPDAAEDEVQFIPFFWTVMWSILRRQNTFQQVTQHLKVTNVNHWSDLFKPGAYCFQTDWHVLVKQYGKIGSFRLRLTRVNPAAYVPVIVIPSTKTAQHLVK